MKTHHGTEWLNIFGSCHDYSSAKENIIGFLISVILIDDVESLVNRSYYSTLKCLITFSIP